MTIEQIKQGLKTQTTQQIQDQVELYNTLQSRSVKDEVMLSLLENEMERRFLAWEAHE